MKFIAKFFIYSMAVGLVACDDGKDRGVGLENPIISEEVTEDNYLSGEQFCEFYKTRTVKIGDRTATADVTNVEHGKRLTVPKDYSDPSKGTTEIYAWTPKPFDPDLPSLIIVDGGPGQNTHGVGLEFNLQGWNEIHFDQRGLGCSSPATFAEYRDPNLYSTENVVRDMNEIRQEYGIDKLSVYGISYGTVPATRFGHQFSDYTRAVVLEGVANSGKDLHDTAWKAAKGNEVIASLSSSERLGFQNLMREDSFSSWMTRAVWGIGNSENGYRNLSNILKSIIISEDVFDRELLNEILEKGPDDENRKHTQYPGEVDRHVHRVVYCKELGGADGFPDMGYDPVSVKFMPVQNSSASEREDCESRGVTSDMIKPYQAADYPNPKPMTYFQGSHDGATMATGAIKHWKSVPQGLVNFLLNQKGGHNPNFRDVTDRIDGTEVLSSLGKAQQQVLALAFEGADIPQSKVDAVNSAGASINPGQKWLLFKAPPANMGPVIGELEGIKFEHFRLENLLKSK